MISLLSHASTSVPPENVVIPVLVMTVGCDGVAGRVVSMMRLLFPERLFDPRGSVSDALLSLLSRILAPEGRKRALEST